MMKATCSICGKRSKARGWCAAHYQNWLRYGDPEGKAPPRPSTIIDGKQRCSKCGEVKPIEQFPRRGSAGPYRKDCKACVRARTQAWAVENREELAARKREYQVRNQERIRAQRKAWYAARREKRRAKAREYGVRNREARNARVKDWLAENPEKARLIRARCDMKRRGVRQIDDIERAVVFERDCGICQICGAAVDPERWHLDHITPLSRGGEHSYANVQVSHPRCNQRKNRRLQEELPGDFAEALTA